MGLENNPTRAGRIGWRGFRPLGRRGRDRRGGGSLTSRKNCLDRALASVRSAENTGAPTGLLRRSLLASLASDERSAISPLCPLSLAVSPSGLSTGGSLGRFAEPAARGFRSLGAVRTPLDVATRGFHATMRLGRYACSAPCDRAPGGFYWLAGPPSKTISSVRFDTGSDLGSSRRGAERTGALTRSLARPVPPEHARTP